MLDSVDQEVRQCYSMSQNIALLDYVMLDPSERVRLNIQSYPQRYPALTIRAPVPWHQAYITSSQRAHYSLFIGHATMHALRNLWDTK